MDDDIFSRLEQETIAGCDVKGLPWQRYEATPYGPIGKEFEDLPATVVRCGRQATSMLWIRSCPCISNVAAKAKKWNENGEFPLTAAGLQVMQVLCCDAHRRYFAQMGFPFICPGCGIVYEEYDALVVKETEVFA